MAIGIVAELKRGKVNPLAVYIKLKGGAIYRHKQEIPVEKQAQFAKSIGENGRKVRLKHWFKVNS